VCLDGGIFIDDGAPNTPLCVPSIFDVKAGDCTSKTNDLGECIFSPNYPKEYASSNSRCLIDVWAPAVLYIHDLDLECDSKYWTYSTVASSSCDVLTLKRNGETVLQLFDQSGDDDNQPNNPASVSVLRNDYFTFTVDGSATLDTDYRGFKLCTYEAVGDGLNGVPLAAILGSVLSTFCCLVAVVFAWMRAKKRSQGDPVSNAGIDRNAACVTNPVLSSEVPVIRVPLPVTRSTFKERSSSI